MKIPTCSSKDNLAQCFANLRIKDHLLCNMDEHHMYIHNINITCIYDMYIYICNITYIT